jgi:hypothetical protein
MNIQVTSRIDAATTCPPAYADPVSLHSALAAFNARRMSPALPEADWPVRIREAAEMGIVEGYWLESERRRQAARAAAAPCDPDGFVDWIEDLERTGPGQGDSLFPYLAEQASLDEMRWFLAQEVSGEAGFDDLTALSQVRMPAPAKLEMARNYWDEMGRGNAKGMHGPMLQVLAAALDVAGLADRNVWEAVALSNLMAGLAANRRYAYHSAGALGIIELTAPGRARYVSDGLRRLGVSAKARHYFDLHAVLDVKHSEAWNREVFRTLVANHPGTAPAIAEGALMRLHCGERCFRRYRAQFGLE